MESYSLTEAKAKFSSIISKVLFAREKVVIKRKGKNAAVLIPYEEFLQKWAKGERNEGLLSAKGALAGLEDIDQFVEGIYEARDKCMERGIEEV